MVSSSWRQTGAAGEKKKKKNGTHAAEERALMRCTASPEEGQRKEKKKRRHSTSLTPRDGKRCWGGEKEKGGAARGCDWNNVGGGRARRNGEKKEKER